jgi:hypothetical protein
MLAPGENRARVARKGRLGVEASIGLMHRCGCVSRLAACGEAPGGLPTACTARECMLLLAFQ